MLTGAFQSSQFFAATAVALANAIPLAAQMRMRSGFPFSLTMMSSLDSIDRAGRRNDFDDVRLRFADDLMIMC